ncbi:hypothetical protein [Herbaspirillum sp. NPDC087042]|uniref:hypothetical protein n=1 Tax=Herbaspirillum sp. NPDC087042 TaxID=3364004 RepID=UPI0037FF103D
MNISSHEAAIIALSIASVLVRVLPVFVPTPLGKTARGILERELPLAVFINFSVYIVWTELQTEPVAALVAIAATAVLTLATRLGLILVTAIGTVLYAVTQLVVHV